MAKTLQREELLNLIYKRSAFIKGQLLANTIHGLPNRNATLQNITGSFLNKVPGWKEKLQQQLFRFGWSSEDVNAGIVNNPIAIRAFQRNKEPFVSAAFQSTLKTIPTSVLMAKTRMFSQFQNLAPDDIGSFVNNAFQGRSIPTGTKEKLVGALKAIHARLDVRSGEIGYRTVGDGIRGSVQIAVNNEIINVPVEYARGKVYSGGSIAATRAALRPGMKLSEPGSIMRFQEALEMRMEALGGQVKPGEVRRAIKGTMEEFTDWATHGGRVLDAQQQVYSQSYLLRDKEVLSLAEKLRSHARAAQSVAASNPVLSQVETEQALQSFRRINELVQERGLVPYDLTYERIARAGSAVKIFGMDPSANFTPGIMSHTFEKGTGYLFRKESLSHVTRKLWGGSVTPTIGGASTVGRFDLPVTSLLLGPEMSKRYLGDSASLLGSQRVVRGINIPQVRTVALNLAHAQGTRRSTEVVSALSGYYQDLFKQHGILDALQSKGEWVAGGRGIRVGGRGSPIPVIGASTTETAEGVIAGDPILTPRGHRLKAVRLVAGQTNTLKLHFARGGKDVDITSRGLLLNASKTTAYGGIDLRLGGKQLVDIIARQEDLLGKPLKESLALQSHWLTMAKTGVPTEFGLAGIGSARLENEIAGILGARRRSFRNDDRLASRWILGNNAIVTAEKSTRVASAFKRAGFSEDAIMGIKVSPGNVARMFGRTVGVKEGALAFLGQNLAVRTHGEVGRRGYTMTHDKILNLLVRRNQGFDASLAPIENQLMQTMLGKKAGLYGEYARLFRPEIINFKSNLGLGTPRVLTAEEFSKLKDVPRTVGGVWRPDVLKETVLGIESGGAYVKLPEKVRILRDVTKRSLATGFGGENFVQSDVFFMGSSELHGLRTSKEDVVRANKLSRRAVKVQRLTKKWQEAIAAGASPEELSMLKGEAEEAINEYLIGSRSALGGKKGPLRLKGGSSAISSFRAAPSSTSARNIGKVGLTSRAVKRMLTRSMGMTGGEANEFLREMIAGKETLALMVGRDPTLGPASMQFLQVDLLSKNQISGGLRNIDASGALRVHESSALQAGADFDRDTFYVVSPRNIEEKQAMLQMARLERDRHADFWRIIQQGTKVYKDTYSLPGEQALRAQMGQFSELIASSNTEFARRKLATAIPNVFFRTRTEAMFYLANKADATMELAALGLDTSHSITNKQQAAAKVASELISQQFLDKIRNQEKAFVKGGLIDLSEKFAPMYEIANYRNTRNTKRLEEAIYAAIKDTDLSKMRQPWLDPAIIGAELSSMGLDDTMANRLRWVAKRSAEAFATVELATPVGTNLQSMFAATAGVSRDKSFEQVVRTAMAYDILSEAPLSSMPGEAAPELGARLGRNLGVLSAEEAIAIENETTHDAGRAAAAARDAIKRVSTGEAFKQFIGRTWKGDTWLGGVGGKAALIGAGVIAAKSIMDALTPASNIPMRDVPMPPSPMIPPGQYAVDFEAATQAINPKVALLPPSQTFGISGKFQEKSVYFQQVSRALEAVASRNLSAGPAYGYIEDSNIPMSDHAMEQFIADRRGSDF